MSEEKIDVRKLTVSKAIELFMDGKISKNDLKDALDKRSLFKLSSKQLEDVLYMQRNDSSSFPKKLRIKSSDILYEYGRNLSAGQLMNLADKGYVDEVDVLKALKKNTVLTALAVVAEKETADQKDSSEKDDKPLKEEKSDKTEKPKEVEEQIPSADLNEKAETKNNGVQENETQENSFSEKDILDKETVKSFFSVDKLIKMFFAKKMTSEFTEAYEEAFKDDREFTASRSKNIIKELQQIFQDNLQALFIVIMRLHFKGMVFARDIEDAIKAEYFREETFSICDEYEVLDRDKNVIYSYKRANVTLVHDIEDDSEELDDEVPKVANYSIMEPLTKDEILEAYKDSRIDGELFKRIFTMAELLQMYKHKKVAIKVFSLFDENKRKNEILKAYKEGFIHLEDIMELFFYYDGITAKELKSIIKEMPKKVAIVRFITIDTGFKKIFELYQNKLIDFNTLCLLKYQNYISESEFEQIRQLVNKDEFYGDIKSRVFYTYPNDDRVVGENLEATETLISTEDSPNELPDEISTEVTDETNEEKSEEPVVEISDSEKILLTKVLGISEEEIKTISLIDSKDENGEPTTLDGYQVISDSADGLVIFGKFDYTSPIFVMTYEEASYFLRSRDDDKTYIYDDLMFVQRLENNEQIRVVEHDENMGKTIVQAICDLSETARSRYIDDEQYMQEVNEYIRTIDENYIEMIKESNNNM